MSCGSLSLWFVVVSVLACASSFFTPAPFPLVCRVIHAHVSPSPSHVLWCLCVLCEACHMHCVWWLALSNTLPCCAPSSLLFYFCPSLPPSPSKPQGYGEKRGRKEWLGKERKEEEEERCDAKTSGKGGQKEKKRLRHLVFPGCLQP